AEVFGELVEREAGFRGRRKAVASVRPGESLETAEERDGAAEVARGHLLGWHGPAFHELVESAGVGRVENVGAGDGSFAVLPEEAEALELDGGPEAALRSEELRRERGRRGRVDAVDPAVPAAAHGRQGGHRAAQQ